MTDYDGVIPFFFDLSACLREGFLAVFFGLCADDI